MKSVESNSMLMVVCAKFLDLTRRSTKQEDTIVKILSTPSFYTATSSKLPV